MQRFCDLYNGVTAIEVRDLAYKFAKKLKKKVPPNWMKNQKAGPDWFEGFMRRHPKLWIRKPDAARMTRVSASTFNRHSEMSRRNIKQEPIVCQDIEWHEIPMGTIKTEPMDTEDEIENDENIFSAQSKELNREHENDGGVDTFFDEAIIADEIVKEEPVFSDRTNEMVPPSQLQIEQNSESGKIVKHGNKNQD